MFFLVGHFTEGNLTTYRLPIDPGLLSTFLAVADLKTVSAAARVLHLSQPAVTAQIRKLEGELGATLFLRSAKGMEATDQGKRFYIYARRVHELLEEAGQSVTHAKEATGTLHLGASSTVASDVLPRILAGYAERFPQVSIQVLVGNTEEILQAVRAGRDSPWIGRGIISGLSIATRTFYRR